MAKKIDLVIIPETVKREEIDGEIVTTVTPAVVAPVTYWMIGNINLNIFDETALLSVYIYANEDSRHQRLDNLRAPLEVRQVEVHYHTFKKYFDDAEIDKKADSPLEAIQAAAYALLTNEPEPFGLAGTLAPAVDVIEEKKKK